MSGDASRHCGKSGGTRGLFERGLIVTPEEEGRAKRGVGSFRRSRIAPCTDENQRKKGGFTSEARLSIGLGIVVGLGQVETYLAFSTMALKA